MLTPLVRKCYRIGHPSAELSTPLSCTSSNCRPAVQLLVLLPELLLALLAITVASLWIAPREDADLCRRLSSMAHMCGTGSRRNIMVLGALIIVVHMDPLGFRVYGPRVCGIPAIWVPNMKSLFSNPNPQKPNPPSTPNQEYLNPDTYYTLGCIVASEGFRQHDNGRSMLRTEMEHSLRCRV